MRRIKETELKEDIDDEYQDDEKEKPKYENVILFFIVKFIGQFSY